MLTHLDKCKEIKAEFGLSAARNFLVIIGCIIQGKTVNLYDLKDEVGKVTGKRRTDGMGHYKRLIRFFRDFGGGGLWQKVLMFGLSLLQCDARRAYLDGTEWAIGRFRLHVLVLAVDYRGVAVPFYFGIYNHKGVLSVAERKAFLEKAAGELPFLAGATVIADREFIGDEWFGGFARLSLFLSSGCGRGSTNNA